MRNAYALLGILFILVFLGAWFAFSRASLKLQSNASHLHDIRYASSTMKLQSAAFKEGGSIPAKYTCDGPNVSPPLSFSGIPQGATTLALTMDDPDVPVALKPDGTFDHWVLYNIDPTVNGIEEDDSAGTVGDNGANMPGYTGPCPPKGYEPSEHRYIFTLYALDARLSLAEGASKEALLVAMDGHVIEKTQLIGRYKRP